MSSSLQPHGLWPARLLSAHGMLQARISAMGVPFPTSGDLPDPGVKPKLLRLLHWQAGSLSLSHLGSPPINVLIALNNPSAQSQAGAGTFCYSLDRVWTSETNILNDSRSSNHHSPAVGAHGGGGGGLQISQLGGFPQPVLPKGEMPGHTLAYNESRRASGMFRHALGIRSVLP